MKKISVLLILSFLLANIAILFTEKQSQRWVKNIKPWLVSAGLKQGWVIYDDKDGIPINDYGTQNGRFIGKQRYPMLISQRAFDHYRDYQAGDSAAVRRLLNCTDWLVDNAVHRDGAAFLEAYFPWETYNLTPPWRSAMAHGQALKALGYAYALTREQKYMRLSEQLVNAFYVDVKDGGITHKSQNEGWWYDEYADEGAKDSRVLNGMMFSMLGLLAYHRLSDDPDAIALFDNGVLALKANLHRYDKNGYSFYDLLGQPAGWHYHQVHIELLREIHQVSPEPEFLRYSDKWAAYLETPFIQRTIENPSLMGIAILLLNTGVIFLLLGLGYRIFWYRRSW